jgi:protein-S-isoprenylcysteine O-methyltransferase Ste14
MDRRGYLEKHGIVRSAIRKDLFYFGLPALTVLTLGLIVCGRDDYDGMVGTLIMMLLDPRAARWLPMSKIVGLVLMIIGFAIAFTALFTLKRFYASTLVARVDHQLITHGIYRFVRHPAYLGVLLVCVVALPVYSSSAWGFLVLSLLIPIFLGRIRMEERLLIEHFGDEYREYEASTRKLIPFVY